MNNRAILSAIFIAVLATSATYVSPAAAIPQRQNADPILTIPINNVSYEVNGTFYAWVNLTTCKIVASASGIPEFSSINITIPEFYVGIRISVAVKNIIFDVTDPEHPSVTGNVSVDASVTGRANVYFNYTSDGGKHYQDSFYDHKSMTWPGEWYIPWGSTTNFTMPFPVFDISASEPNATKADPQAGIKFTNENLTGTDTSWTVTHNSWDFSKWLQDKVNSTLNGFAGEAMQKIQTAGIPGIQMGFTVPTGVGKVDLWKANAKKDGTTIPNVLLMASALINLLVKFYFSGHGSFTGDIEVEDNTYHATLNYDISVGADFGMFFSLTVTSNLGHKVMNDYEIDTFEIQVPENATLTWKKIGVIVYYGSPAHGCDVTGGVVQGNATVGGGTMFFVDYGVDGTPDFAVNGTQGSLSTLLSISNPPATVSGSTPKFTIQLDKSADGWIYFRLQLPSGTSESDITVKRSDGKTVNATQYWITGNYLYVCDDPTYTYTVELIGGAGAGAGIGLTSILIIGAAVVAVVLVSTVVLMRRRGGKPTNVSIK